MCIHQGLFEAEGRQTSFIFRQFIAENVKTGSWFGQNVFDTVVECLHSTQCNTKNTPAAFVEPLEEL